MLRLQTARQQFLRCIGGEGNVAVAAKGAIVAPAQMQGRSQRLARQQPGIDFAGQLAEQSRLLMRNWSTLRHKPPEAEPASPRACLHAAALLCGLPGSRRQFYRLLLAKVH